MKRFLIVLLVSVILSGAATARELHHITSNPMVDGFLDADTLKHTPTISEGWVTTFWYNKKDEPISKFHFVFNCADEKFKIDQIKTYDSQGKLKQEITQPDEFSDMPPRSNAAELFKPVCYEKFNDPDEIVPSRIEDAALLRLLSAKSVIS